jgi:hypothetical protein
MQKTIALTLTGKRAKVDAPPLHSVHVKEPPRSLLSCPICQTELARVTYTKRFPFTPRVHSVTVYKCKKHGEFCQHVVTAKKTDVANFVCEDCDHDVQECFETNGDGLHDECSPCTVVICLLCNAYLHTTSADVMLFIKQNEEGTK